LTKHDWLEALLFAVAVAVGHTPEILPMIVTGYLRHRVGRLKFCRSSGTLPTLWGQHAECPTTLFTAVQHFEAFSQSPRPNPSLRCGNLGAYRRRRQLGHHLSNRAAQHIARQHPFSATPSTWLSFSMIGRGVPFSAGRPNQTVRLKPGMPASAVVRTSVPARPAAWREPEFVFSRQGSRIVLATPFMLRSGPVALDRRGA
jgi:hypothetical protein